MSELKDLIIEQIKEYKLKLEEIEKVLARKYKLHESFADDVIRANGYKMLIKEAVNMIAEF